MIFDNIVNNKVTEFIARRGDELCRVTYEYNIESIEEVIKAFKTILEFLGYNPEDLKEYYREEILEEFND